MNSADLTGDLRKRSVTASVEPPKPAALRPLLGNGLSFFDPPKKALTRGPWMTGQALLY